MRVGVGVQFGLWLSALGVVAAALTGYYAYSESRKLLVDSASERLLTSTDVIGQHFAEAIEAVATDVALAARLPDVADLARGAPDDAAAGRQRARVTEVFDALLAGRDVYLQVRLIGVRERGREIVRIDRTAAGTTRVEGPSLQEKGHRPYVYRTARLLPGEFYVSPINLDRERGTDTVPGRPTVRVATPVRGLGDSVFGVVVVSVDLDVLFSRLRAELPENVQVFLANANGDYLLHPDEARTFGFDRGRRHLVQNEFPGVSALLDGSAEGVLLETGEERGVDAARVASFLRVPFGSIAPDRFVLLGLGVPLAATLEAVDALGRRLAMMVLAFSLLAVVVSVVLSRLLVRPLDRIVASVQQFSRGLPIGALPTGRRDEIGLLARTFESMSGQIGQHIEELQRYRERLETLVEQRTASLRAAQNDALRNERLAAIGQLTGTVSHELRNPMGVLRTSVSVLRMRLAREDADPKVVQVLERMERSISRCDGIIEELLDYTRLRELELEETAIDDWLRELLLDQDLPGGVELSASLDSGVRCLVDRRRLAQAVVNVIDNACHALTECDPPIRRPGLTLTTATRDEHVELVIADNGPGMPGEVRERVFEPLFSTRAHGVGLGLPLVRQILEQHHGSVEIDSAPGEGTRVTLLLPRNARDHE